MPKFLSEMVDPARLIPEGRKTLATVVAVARGAGYGFWGSLMLAVPFLFLCNLTIWTFPGHPEAPQFKKYGLMAGVALAFAFLAVRGVRGAFTLKVRARTLWGYLLFCALFLEILILGAPHIYGYGQYFAILTSNFWDTDFPNVFSVLLKRAVLPTLGHLLGFRSETYIYFWFFLYFVALLLAVRWLILLRFSALECLSLLSSSIFAFALIMPGYSEMLLIVGALYCLQRKTTLLEKLLIFVLSVGTHEIAACVVFLGVMVASDRQERDEWLILFILVLPVNLFLDLLNGFLQKGTRPGETLMMDGKPAFQWLYLKPFSALLGVLVAYKLYWIPMVLSWRMPGIRRYAIAAFISLPLIVIATDTSRIVQFASLSAFIVVAKVMADWTAISRRNLALANLVVPTFYCSSIYSISWGWGLYSLLTKVCDAMGLHHHGLRAI